MSFFLQTKRLILRDFSEQDIEAYVDLYRSEQYCRFYPEQDCDLDFQRSIAKSFIEKSKQSPRKDFSLAIIDIASEIFCGVISLRLEDDNAASVGCGVAVEYQGQGFSEEAMRAILDFALSELNVQGVIAETMYENKAATHLCQKLGFKLNLELSETKNFRGQEFTSVRYELS